MKVEIIFIFQNKNATDRARQDLTATLKVLDAHLLHCTFLVGERLSLADICVACNLLLPYQHVLDKQAR